MQKRLGITVLEGVYMHPLYTGQHFLKKTSHEYCKSWKTYKGFPLQRCSKETQLGFCQEEILQLERFMVRILREEEGNLNPGQQFFSEKGITFNLCPSMKG